jgi:mRNA interferase HigB
MNIIYLNKLKQYAKKHSNAANCITAWKQVTEKATWKQSSDILKSFPKASPIKNNRTRFPICGGNFRLVVEVDYADETVEIRFIGTHSEYDEIDATTI